jgi:hypothetical protein
MLFEMTSPMPTSFKVVVITHVTTHVIILICVLNMYLTIFLSPNQGLYGKLTLDLGVPFLILLVLEVRRGLRRAGKCLFNTKK